MTGAVAAVPPRIARAAAAEPYAAPFWLPGGHLQTIVPARVLRAPFVAYRRTRWDTPDGDFIDLDAAQPEPTDARAPVLVLFHGLEGDSRSHYARLVMRAAADRGWRGLVAHFRGCSGEPNRLLRAYHSGDSEEVDWILRRVAAAWPAAPLHAVGVSLGGNTLAKWLGERGSEASFVRAAVAVGSPLDLVAGGEALGRGFNLLYAAMFLATLRRKALDKAARFAGAAGREEVPAFSLDTARLRAARTLRTFDDLYTAPVHGFRDAIDYWTRASARPLLKAVAVPFLLLNARNDPFVPASSLPGAAHVSADVVLDQPEGGGHIGFAYGPRGDVHWLPRRLMAFLSAGR
jgi:hypothetical protein